MTTRRTPVHAAAHPEPESSAADDAAASGPKRVREPVESFLLRLAPGDRDIIRAGQEASGIVSTNNYLRLLIRAGAAKDAKKRRD